MRRAPLAPLLFLAVAAPVWLGAQTPSVTPATESPTTSSVAADPFSAAIGPPAAPARASVISPQTRAKLALAAPKYEPPKPADVTAAPVEREKPRNGIIRLPDYVVREKKDPDFKERQLLTPKGKIELALKRHPGLRLGNLFGLNNAVGLEMLEEEFRLERMAELADLLGLAQIGGYDPTGELALEAKRSFIRPSSWVNTGGPHAGPYSFSAQGK